MIASSRRTITDDLLMLSVRIKQEAGVSHAQIQAVVDRFASQEHWQERTGGIGFPLVEDIPQTSRADFMAALAELSAQGEHTYRQTTSRVLSANDIWPSRTM